MPIPNREKDLGKNDCSILAHIADAFANPQQAGITTLPCTGIDTHQMRVGMGVFSVKGGGATLCMVLCMKVVDGKKGVLEELWFSKHAVGRVFQGHYTGSSVRGRRAGQRVHGLH